MRGLSEIQRMNRDATDHASHPGSNSQNFTPEVRAYLVAHPLATITDALKACEELPQMIEDATVEDFDYQQAHEDIRQ